MAQGQVVFVSGNGAMIVVRHDDGYALVEMLGDEGELAVGDQVFADWDALGSEPLKGNGRNFDAFFQGSWGGYEIPVEMAVNTGGLPRRQ